jgi:hypothetical protein
MYKPGRQTVSVHPLLWDGMEDASAVAQAIVPALISAVAALPTADGSPATCVPSPFTSCVHELTSSFVPQTRDPALDPS